jgi:hypothetical protein
MGALIFLLLVTTRQLRAVAVERAQAALRQQVEDVPILPDVASEPEPPRLLPSAVAWEPAVPVPTPSPPVSQDDLDRPWRQRLAQLEAEQKTRAQALARQKLLAAAAQRRIAELQQELKQLETEYGELTGQLSATELQPASGNRERLRLEQQIAALRQQLKQIEDQQRSTDGRFAIVPFDGKSGTTRRPILIECTSTGLRFVAEDITLKPGDIEGFDERFNPLLAGSLALVNYWNQWNIDHAQDDVSADPYVLLIVRPSGTLAYYIAQRMLSTLKQPHGYELVAEDLPLLPPPADAGAKAACQAAIQRTLAERQQVLGDARGGRFGSSGQAAGVAGGQRPPVGRGVQSGKTEFEMADLEAGTPAVGNRSWESPERFEGQEFRRNRSAPAEPASRAGRPEPLPRETGAAARPVPQSEHSEWSSASGGSERRTSQPALSPDLPHEDGRYPSFAKSQRSSAQTRDLPYEQLQRRKWGPHDPGASIGVERTVVIHIDAQRLVVDRDVVIPVPLGATRNEVFDRLLMVIDQSSQTWGKPGAGFFWIPSLKFVISPGGNQVYERIAPLVTKCGLSSSTEFTLEQSSPAPRGGQP